jgi:disulfide bond formation protein DsbB
MKKIISSLPHLAAAVALTSAGALSFAYISQYGFGLDPCQLCYYQRIPYFLNIALGILAFLLASRNKKTASILLALSALSFLTGAVLAGFHVGVEQHWWKGLESCSNYAMPGNASVADLKKFLLNRAPVRCDIPAFVLFGISMAGYNFILSLVLAAGTLYSLRTSWRAN